MVKNKLLILCVAIGTTLFSCKPKVPDYVIPEDKMTDILYDYHMAKSLSSDVSYREPYKKEAYKNYVFQKHGITEAELDSSMVWYSRHPDKIAVIYKEIEARLTTKLDKVSDILRFRENKFIKTISADTANVWGAKQLYLLTTMPNNSHLFFNEEVDTTFHINDEIVFKANYKFIDSTEKQQARTNITLIYDNKEVENYELVTHKNGMDSIKFKTSSESNIKELYLSIYLNNSFREKEGAPSLYVKNIEFIRRHID